MVTTPPKSIFPSHAVSYEEKRSLDYGLQVGRAIESEWFKDDRASSRYFALKDSFHNLRLYARGEQPVQKYKDELAIDGDMSYLNLDWKPVPIVPKFVDIVVNGISERPYELKTFCQDPASMNKRTEYINNILIDMKNKEAFNVIKQETGINVFANDPTALPESDEELSLHMQLEYKDSIEIAEQEALNNVFSLNKYEYIKKRLDYDITVLGIGCLKNSFNTAEGIKIEYVDPVNIVYSYTESPFFDDLYYVGEVKRVSIPELKKSFPHLTEEDVKKLESSYSGERSIYKTVNTEDSYDSNYVNVLYFEYKTYQNQVYKIKETASGGIKSIKKTDNFDPPKDDRSRFEKVDRSIEVLYSGAKIVGLDMMLAWDMNKNMTRPKSDITKVNMSYSIVAPRLYRGVPESLVGRMISFADMIQLTHMKLQQVLNRIVPDGVYLDADGLSQIDLGNGTSYTPEEALNMYFQTGSVIGRSLTQDGDFNNARMPIQQLTSSGGNAKIASLFQSYNHYLQMIRDVTGLNEARDGSSPDKDSLVGLQKLAAANSNTATRHIIQAGLYVTLKMAEGVSLRISDVLEYSSTRESFINSLGRFNVATLDEIRKLQLHDFGIFIQLAPDEEEKAMLENNIQLALSRNQIDLEDAIDIREIKNLKLANQLLKKRRKDKDKRDRQIAQENMQMQGQVNAQSAQAAAEADMQKEQALAASKVQVEQAVSQFAIQKMEREAQLKKELMQFEYELNIGLEEKKMAALTGKEKFKEDRKDERTKIQATQQSQLIDQRKSGTPPKTFESSGFDNMGGFGFEQFEPK